jgi:hypothetical protein
LRNFHFIYAGFEAVLVGQASRLSCIRLLLLIWSTETVDLPIFSNLFFAPLRLCGELLVKLFCLRSGKRITSDGDVICQNHNKPIDTSSPPAGGIPYFKAARNLHQPCHQYQPPFPDVREIACLLRVVASE